MKRIGIITIGQAPRSDVVPDMAAILGREVEIVEAGAIDDLNTAEELATVAPRPGETVLVSRQRDGRQVQLARERIVPRLQASISLFERQGLAVILLLCTGQFEGFDYHGLLLEPDKLVCNFVAGVFGAGLLGILVPEPEQVEQMARKWQAPGRQVIVATGSPYKSIADVERGARRLCELNPQLVVLDCMGYRVEHKRLVADMVSCPVILSNTAVARMLAEIL